MYVGKARSFKKDLEPNPSASGIYSERCVFYAPLAGIEKHFLKELINSSIDSFISPFFLSRYALTYQSFTFEEHRVMRMNYVGVLRDKFIDKFLL